MKTTVVKRGPAQFDMCGQFICHYLKDTGEEISPGLALRLLRYAEARAQDVGILAMLRAWTPSVYTMDGDERPSGRAYNVKWDNGHGFSIELCQILTRNGWPFLDHQFSCSNE